MAFVGVNSYTKALFNDADKEKNSYRALPAH